MESDKLVLEDQSFNLRQCVEESLDPVSVKASEKGLNLSYTIDKGFQILLSVTPAGFDRCLATCSLTLSSSQMRGPINILTKIYVKPFTVI